MYTAVARQSRRLGIASFSVGCGLLAASLTTRWDPRVAFRSIAGFSVRLAPTYCFVPGCGTAIRFFSASSTLSGIFDTSSLSTSNMSNLTPPQPPPMWTHTPEDLLRLTKGAIEEDRRVQDQVAKLPASECNFNTVSVQGPCSCALDSHSIGLCKRLVSILEAFPNTAVLVCTCQQ
jgi:hypothetical protein